MGGCAVAHAAKNAWTDRELPMYRYDSADIGTVRVTLHENHKSIILDTSRSQQKELPEILQCDDRDSRSFIRQTASRPMLFDR